MSRTSVASVGRSVNETMTRRTPRGRSDAGEPATVRKVASTSRSIPESARAGTQPLPVNGCVLPDLELGEVEAERLDLPAEVLDLAPGGAREADSTRASWTPASSPIRSSAVAYEPGGPSSVDSPARRSPTEPAPSPPKPLRDEAETAAGTARPGSAPTASGQATGMPRRRSRAGVRARPGFPRPRALPRAPASVACATASWPRRTWSAWIRKASSVISAVTSGCPSRSPPIHESKRTKAGVVGPLELRVAAGAGRGKRPFDRSIQARGEPVDRLVEEDHRGADLVDRSQGAAADLGGSPQQRDLLAQPAAELRGWRTVSAAGRRDARGARLRGGVRRGRSGGGPPSDGPSGPGPPRAGRSAAAASVAPPYSARASRSDAVSDAPRLARARRARCRTRSRSSARLTSWKSSPNARTTDSRLAGSRAGTSRSRRATASDRRAAMARRRVDSTARTPPARPAPDPWPSREPRRRTSRASTLPARPMPIPRGSATRRSGR